MSGSILIRDGAILAKEGWIDPGYVWIDGPTIGAIVQGAPPEALVARADTVLEARHCAVIPGLVNGHTHLSQTLMRGLAGGRALLPWLKTVVWPIQAALTPEELHLAALLGLVENLRCGVTTVVDHHKISRRRAHTDAVLRAAETSGLRVTVARAWSDLGADPEPAAAILEDLQRRFEQWQGHPRITVADGPLALWRCSAETLTRAHELAQSYESFTHLHASESADEVDMSLARYDKRPIQWLADLGILDAATDVVHGVWVNVAELDHLAQSDARVVHCPVSNAVLGSGIAPISKMMDRGMRLRLGTDGPASNDTQDLFETLKTAVMMARATTQDPTVLPPATALRLALDQRVLAPDAPADVAVVALDHARAVPVHDIASALVLSTHGSDVNDVIVAGQLLLHHGKVLNVDEPALRDACRAVAQRLSALVTV